MVIHCKFCFRYFPIFDKKKTTGKTSAEYIERKSSNESVNINVTIQTNKTEILTEDISKDINEYNTFTLDSNISEEVTLNTDTE